MEFRWSCLLYSFSSHSFLFSTPKRKKFDILFVARSCLGKIEKDKPPGELLNKTFWRTGSLECPANNIHLPFCPAPYRLGAFVCYSNL